MLATTCAIIAASMHVAALYLYNRQMVRGESVPKTATWGLWVILSTLNCLTYLSMSGDFIKTTLPIVSTFITVIFFVKAAATGKFGRLKTSDWLALAFGGIATLVWWIFHSSTAANMLLQIPIIISFWPTYIGVMQNPKNERPIPWYMWSGAYVFSLSSIFLLWHYDPKPQDGPEQLVYPILCLILHGGVGLVAQFRKTRS